MSREVVSKQEILQLAEGEGFSRSRILHPLPSWTPAAHTDAPFPEQALSALMVFLPYERSGEASVLAPFAQSNYYREAVARLKRIASVVRNDGGFSKGDLRLFCNSRFPEKQMAWQCGLGTLGRNSLLITPEYGSLGIIAGMFLPFELEGDFSLERQPYDDCGACTLCRSACPAEAIRDGGGIDRSLCFQNLSTRNRLLPEEILPRWNILYGCQICQDVCPRNRNKPPGLALSRGYLGPDPDLDFILNSSPEELKEYLKGTVMGQSWIDPVLLRRNALICLWNRKTGGEKRQLAEFYRHHEEEILSRTAESLLKASPPQP